MEPLLKQQVAPNGFVELVIHLTDNHCFLPGMVYISLRQLEREFKQKVGITPKQYHRIARLNDVYRRLEDNQQVEFTKIAFDCGYSDQAHFIRDFKSIMGVKPTIFIKEKQQYIVNS